MAKNITLAIPDDLAEEMARFTHIRWSEVARRAIRQELDQLRVFDELLAASKLTEEDAVELGREVRRSAGRKLLRKLGRPAPRRRPSTRRGRKRA